jgi:hypothetical protein
MTGQTQKPQDQEKPNEVAREPVGDEALNPAPGVAGQPAIEPPAPAADAERAPVEIDSNVDRANIAQKFAAKRAAENAGQPFSGNMGDPALRAGVASVVQPEPDPEPKPDDNAPPAEARESGPFDSGAKPKHKLVVRRDVREVDDDELIRLAQIGAANESYLGEARKLLDETRRVVSSRPHPDAGEPDAERTGDDDVDQPHKDDPFAEAAKKVRFGDDEEAAEALRTTTVQVAGQEAAKAVYNQQRQLDVARATRAYTTFKESNADLIADPIAETAMERIYHDELRNDLRKIGYPDDKIPKNRDALVETHRFHRIHGQPVRETSELLDAAKTGFANWRGGQRQEPAPRSQSGLEVTVDRTERRAAIPQQPTRAAIPQKPTAQPSQGNARSNAVQQMRQARGFAPSV